MDKSKRSMALFQDAGGDPRERFAAVLTFYGALGDAAAGNARGFAARKAGVAVAFARLAGLDASSRDALAFAGTLHAVGAIGVTEARREDVPVLGARICAGIAALPRETAELVRAQCERWDGTGFPDALRWNAIPLGAQLLLLAEVALRQDDLEDALDVANVESGRSLSPEVVRIFIAWARDGGVVEPVQLPHSALCVTEGDADALFERITAHVAHVSAST